MRFNIIHIDPTQINHLQITIFGKCANLKPSIDKNKQFQPSRKRKNLMGANPASATALAHPNIAFIKYWGNRDASIRLPENGSISMNLESLHTTTRVEFSPALSEDEIVINGEKAKPGARARVVRLLDEVRALGSTSALARVTSNNNFPMSAGIASSASAFAALTLAACAASGLMLSSMELSRLARRASGSACRSVPGGFVEWQAGEGDESSYAFTIAPPDRWDLVDCIAIVNDKEKEISSTVGHGLAHTSPLQAARVADAPRRLELCREAISRKDFTMLAEIVELDSDMMHAVMMTSRPSLHYWLPETLAVMRAVRRARRDGLEVCYTIDAGPNVHVISTNGCSRDAMKMLTSLPGILEVKASTIGGAAKLL
jgi:diphosphomevalonate decarboxylase